MGVRASRRMGVPRICVCCKRVGEGLDGMIRESERQLTRRFLTQVERGIRGSFQLSTRRSNSPKGRVMSGKPSRGQPRSTQGTFLVGSESLTTRQGGRYSNGRRRRKSTEAGRNSMSNATRFCFTGVKQYTQVGIGEIYTIAASGDGRNCRTSGIRPSGILEVLL